MLELPFSGLLNTPIFKLLLILKLSKNELFNIFNPFQGPSVASRTNGRHQPPADTNPQIRQEFLLCGYRWGHAQVTEKVTSANSRLSIDRSRDLKDSFFDPDLLHMQGPGLSI